MKATDLEWGLKLAGVEAPALWGARAIFDYSGKRPIVDVVWDRQGAQGERPAVAQLLALLNDKGVLNAFRRLVALDPPESEEVQTVEIDGVSFWYALRGGYVYITAGRISP